MPSPNRRRVGARRRNELAIDSALMFAKSTSLLSVNGTLRSMYYLPGETEDRAQEYTELEVEKPIVVRYLYHFLRLENSSNSKQEIMISSFLKTEEEKRPAAEAINYYNPQMRFSKGTAEIEHYGGDVYGHELIYYSKSYTGEPIKLTTKIMELDNPEKSIKEIETGLTKIGELPFFAEYMPYVAIAKSTTSLLGRIFKILDRDDPIVPALRLDLFYKRPNSARLQSGRIVCVQGKAEDEILNAGFKLNAKNRLEDTEGKLYTQTPYFVIQVNSETQSGYDDFEYFQNAAELLAMTNRPDGIKDFVETAALGFKTYSDIATINQMEDMQDDLDNPESLKKFKALFKTMSSDVKDLYRNKYKEILKETEDG